MIDFWLLPHNLLYLAQDCLAQKPTLVQHASDAMEPLRKYFIDIIDHMVAGGPIILNHLSLLTQLYITKTTNVNLQSSVPHESRNNF